MVPSYLYSFPIFILAASALLFEIRDPADSRAKCHRVLLELCVACWAAIAFILSMVGVLWS